MDPQPEALPAWVASFLDDCQLDGELDPVSHYLIKLYADRPWIAGIVDRYNSEGLGPERFRARRNQRVQWVREEADRLWPIAPKAVRRGIVFSAILDWCVLLRDTAHHYAGWAITDFCEGGCKENFRAPPRPGLREAWMPGKKAARRARSSRFIRNYIRNLEGVRDFRESGQRLLAFIDSEPGPYIGRNGEGERVDAAIADMLEAQVPTTLPEPEYRRDLLRWLEGVKGIKVRRLKKRAKRRLELQRRRRITRAANFAAGLIGPQAVNQFIRGGVIKIAGPDLTFGISRADRDLAAESHGCLNIGVKATEGNVPLGLICFYFENTPMLDQVAAIALHAQSGTEKEILAAANMVRVAPEGVDHPLLVERRAAAELRERAQQEEMAALIAAAPEEGSRNPIYRGRFRPGQNYDPRELRERRNRDYWRDTGNIWIATLATQVMGARYAPAFSMLAFVDTPVAA